ncbi:MAG: MgtC/SapB family protein [Erysipelotrichaceae bacterium]|nr:MgtC/SapB family protein [Erysipelotrichaceae bacterium]
MESIRDFISYTQEFNMLSVMLRIVLAIIAGGVIGNERGMHGSAAGLRTHIFVCVGGALTSLCSLYVSRVLGFNGDVFRIPASVVSGIGFLGAGTILVKSDSSIVGLTTAAGMWVTAITGIALGYGFYTGGVITTLICIVNATLFTRIEHNRLRYMRSTSKSATLTLSSPSSTRFMTSSRMMSTLIRFPPKAELSAMLD